MKRSENSSAPLQPSMRKLFSYTFTEAEVLFLPTLHNIYIDIHMIPSVAPGWDLTAELDL